MRICRGCAPNAIRTPDFRSALGDDHTKSLRRYLRLPARAPAPQTRRARSSRSAGQQGIAETAESMVWKPKMTLLAAHLCASWSALRPSSFRQRASDRTTTARSRGSHGDKVVRTLRARHVQLRTAANACASVSNPHCRTWPTTPTISAS